MCLSRLLPACLPLLPHFMSSYFVPVVGDDGETAAAAATGSNGCGGQADSAGIYCVGGKVPKLATFTSGYFPIRPMYRRYTRAMPPDTLTPVPPPRWHACHQACAHFVRPCRGSSRVVAQVAEVSAARHRTETMPR